MAALQTLRTDGAILLLSLYELGHAPHGVAMPAGFLERAGFRPRVLDLAIDRLDDDAVRSARLICLSVPMHTALRLGIAALARIRRINPDAAVCFYGMYAPLHADHLRSLGVDFAIGGETEEALVDVARSLDAGAPSSTDAGIDVVLDRLRFGPPARAQLPSPDRYSRLLVGDETRLGGYAETTRGCLHRCRHCPVPAVYDGRLFAIDRDSVLADIDAQVAAGSQHITFGDPDFWCGPGHSMAIVRALAERHPTVTFDATIKVSHLLRYADRLGELRKLGCAFIITAVESLRDDILERLDKGHTRADFERALALCEEHGITMRPTFLPFTPWTNLADMVELADFLYERELVDAVDPVQLTVRLLVPRGSLLLDRAEDRAAFGPLDAEALTHRWQHPDPRVDALQRELAGIVEAAGSGTDRLSNRHVFDQLRAAIHRADGRPAPAAYAAPQRPVPRMTEHWFC